jgi:hypothetical protein
MRQMAEFAHPVEEITATEESEACAIEKVV